MKKYFVIIISLFLFGCNKNYVSKDKSNFNTKTINISNDSIGIIHNEGLDYIINNYSNPSSNIDTLFDKINTLQKDFFTSKVYSEENMSSELKDLVLTGDGITWLNNMYNLNKITISNEFKDYLVDILQFTYNGINNPFNREQYYSFLDSTYLEAESILSDTEMDELSKHISVAKYSFDYWFNEDGTPKGPTINSNLRSWNGWQTLGADCIGGIFGGVCGYLGASALDVFYQITDD